MKPLDPDAALWGCGSSFHLCLKEQSFLVDHEVTQHDLYPGLHLGPPVEIRLNGLTKIYMSDFLKIFQWECPVTRFVFKFKVLFSNDNKRILFLRCTSCKARIHFRSTSVKRLPHEMKPRWKILFSLSWQEQWVRRMTQSFRTLRFSPLAIYREIF